MAYSKTFPIFIVCLITLFSSCKKEQTQICDHVTITLTNDLGIDIDEMIINGESFPLPDGQTSSEICFPEINLDPVVPVVPFEAQIGSEQCLSMYSFYCGVGMVLQDNGTFNIKLTSWYIAGPIPPCQINYDFE